MWLGGCPLTIDCLRLKQIRTKFSTQSHSKRSNHYLIFMQSWENVTELPLMISSYVIYWNIPISSLYIIEVEAKFQHFESQDSTLPGYIRFSDMYTLFGVRNAATLACSEVSADARISQTNIIKWSQTKSPFNMLMQYVNAPLLIMVFGGVQCKTIFYPSCFYFYFCSNLYSQFKLWVGCPRLFIQI